MRENYRDKYVVWVGRSVSDLNVHVDFVELSLESSLDGEPRCQSVLTFLRIWHNKLKKFNNIESEAKHGDSTE